MAERTKSFKNKVYYQIWPRSFKDGNGDGLGDLYGVLEKLDYIRSLGVDGIWFSPLYVSPGVDCGYDIADYYHIAPEFGGDEAFDLVLRRCRELDLQVIMDLVVNHTSTDCEWFRKSRLRIEPYTDYYIWRPARKNGRRPNNWDSEFEGGSAWQWDDVRGEYYLHIFAISQADLNMDNPLVREEVKKIQRYWLDKGVYGFREDVITYISKPEGLPDERIFPIHKGLTQYNMGPHLHEYLSEFKTDVLDGYDHVTIAEATLIKPKKALTLIGEGPGQVIDMVIQFECQCADCFLSDYLPLPFSLRKLKRAFGSWQTALHGKGWNLLYLENHDHPRIVSRYGSEKYRPESAKVLCAMYMFQQGTPFIYQGQELGMTSFRPASAEEYEDVQTRNYAPNLPPKLRLRLLQRASRDAARTPVQWSGGPNAGFSEAEPWFSVNPNYTRINAAAQEEDPYSVLNFYRRCIALRKSLPVVREGTYRDLLPLSSRLYVYAREYGGESLLVICSFADSSLTYAFPRDFDPREGEKILDNYPDELREDLSTRRITLRPRQVQVYHFNRRNAQ